MDTMTAIKDTFFQECAELLGDLETGLLAMQDGATDTETVNAVFRAVHSIKGGAGAFKLDQLVRFAHTFETTLDQIRNNCLDASPAVMKVMLRAADMLADLVEAARTEGQADEARAAVLIAELNALTAAEGNGSTEGHAPSEAVEFDFQPIALSFSFDDVAGVDVGPVKKTYRIRFKPKAELYRSGNETTRLLRELGRLGETEISCDTSNLPPLSELAAENSYLAWNIVLRSTEEIGAVKDVFEFVDGDCELDIRLDEAEAQNSATVIEPMSSGSAAGIADNVVAFALPADSNQASAKGTTPSIPPAAEPSPRETSRATAETQKPESSGAAAAGQTTIRVDLERVDRLINLVGELVINQAMLSQRVIEAGVARGSRVAAGLDELEQLTREIQESVMAIRAQPVRPLFQRMSRIVREVADATNKSVRLRTDGEATEVDRTVIERLADPLTHMIRNAVDHGLETPEERIAAGKPEQGEVRLSAVHRSGRIVIEVADDGAGINRPRVKGIAIKKGLISPDAQLTDNEIDNLLFLPGFSTAETISNISGRGVGMDVVKRSIQALGGRISITSRPGHGSTFSMSLPLTLAVLDGMVVKVADQTLVVPLTAIVETLKPKAQDIHGLGVDAGVLANRGGFTPLVDVGRELGYRSQAIDPMQSVTLLVETEGGVRSALMVDAIQDQRQVVIKSLEANYGHVPGIAAATILGDGRIALILDVDALVAKKDRSNVASYSHLAATG